MVLPPPACDSQPGGSAFYDFLPYKFGPYSFTLVREAQRLADGGLLAADDKTWRSGPAGVADTGPLPAEVARDVGRTLRRQVDRSLSDLLDSVYAAYPQFTVNSERQRLATRPTAVAAVYTAGYEGEAVDAFLNRLVEVGISCLTDVRHNPISRKYGFHKSTLARLCSAVGISYVHAPELGIRSALRQNLGDAAARVRLFDEYESQVRRLDLADLCARVAAGSTVLVCQEAAAGCCHRSRLARVVAERTGLPVVHLEVGPCPRPSSTPRPTC